MKIDLHLVSWNRPKMTELVIKTIHRNTKPENFRLVVLDNGSELSVREMLMRFHDSGLIDELHIMSENMGLEAARQFLLFKATDSPYFVCIDNDCLPPSPKEGKDWVERLHELITKNEDYAAISARTQVMIGTGNIFEKADESGDELVDFPWPGGSLRIMDTFATRSVGGWEGKAPGRGAEERFICGRLTEAGWKTAFATNVRTLHLFGTRGDVGTDRWGYNKNWKPEDSGHNDIAHPALSVGDIKDELLLYAAPEDVEAYYA